MTSYSHYPAPRRVSPLPLLIAGAALVLALWLLFERRGASQALPTGDPRPITPRASLADFEKSIIAVFERASPSVAHITTRVQVDYGFRTRQQEGTGSGFVWDDRGTVITNFHVVRDASEVKVAFADRVFTADVLTGSPDHDIAVLRLQGDVSGLRPLDLGRSADLKVGQTVLAIGNPYGFDTSLSTGVVSALNRTIRTDANQGSRESHQLSNLIQVDAAINPGNSGGPLLDSAGRLIGITTAIYSPSGASAGIGFAVPVDTVNDVVPRLIAGRRLIPALGLKNNYEQKEWQILVGGRRRYGAVFDEVIPGSGAEAAGLQPFEVDEQSGKLRKYGDVILAVGDYEVRTFSEISKALSGRAVGQKVKVTFVRGLPDPAQARIMTTEVELKAVDQ